MRLAEKRYATFGVVTLAAAVACGGPSGDTSTSVGTQEESITVRTHGSAPWKLPYKGGHVMSGTVNIYLIFYGSSWGTNDKTYFQHFVDGIDWVKGPTQVWNIVTTYYDQFGARASNDLRLNGTWEDDYAEGHNLVYAVPTGQRRDRCRETSS